MVFPEEALLQILPAAFEEDVNGGDITSIATIPKDEKSVAVINAKEWGVFAGGPVIPLLFQYRKYPIEISRLISEGTELKVGDSVVMIKASTRHILECERILLNFIQRMSGIATQARRFQNALKGSTIKILDTRKTLPGYRDLDKYSVFTGGAYNHRKGLFDQILIKDNHIQAAGSVRQAIDAVAEKYGARFFIEAEIQNFDQLPTLKGSQVQRVLLDNMNRMELEDCIKFLRSQLPQVEIEISGNMNLESVKSFADLDIDFISVGQLTHSTNALDLSLKFL